MSFEIRRPGQDEAQRRICEDVSKTSPHKGKPIEKIAKDEEVTKRRILELEEKQKNNN